jgi:hypothetical protein
MLSCKSVLEKFSDDCIRQSISNLFQAADLESLKDASQPFKQEFRIVFNPAGFAQSVALIALTRIVLAR